MARTPRRHPAQREDIEQWMNDKGVKWTFHPNVKPEAFDKDKSMRNQARISQPLSPERLETYTEAMQRGDKFPAVIAYKVDGKYVAVDGNHRLQAAEDADATLGVYELDKDTKPAVIVQMTYEANAKHGLPNSVEDRQRHAVYLLRSGASSQENVAASLNLSKTQVSKAWAKAKADDRAHDSGLLDRQWNTFSPAAKARMGSIRTDEGFAAFADLAFAAQLNADEIDKHVVELNRSRSSAEQRKKVEQMRQLYRDRIQSTGGGVQRPQGPRGTAIPRVLLLSGMGQVLGVQDKIEQVVADVTDAEIQQVIDQCTVAGMLLDDIVKALKVKQKGE